MPTTAAYMPLAVVGMRQHLKDFFEENPLGWGATYQGHPVAMACAYECVKHMLKEDLPGNAARLEPVMVECIEAIVDKHPCVRQGRAQVSRRRHPHAGTRCTSMAVRGGAGVSAPCTWLAHGWLAHVPYTMRRASSVASTSSMPTASTSRTCR